MERHALPMTITEKILARHSGNRSVRPGDLVEVEVDLALANDITAPLAIRVFHELEAERVFDPEKVVLVQDHFVPNKDIASAAQVKMMAEFAEALGISHYFDLGEAGIEHVILPERGLVVPGDLVIGADSHTCTYGALGAFAAGVGSTDLGVIWATGKTWLRVPETILLVFEGQRPRWVGGKDYILSVIGRLGVDGASYKALEFRGGALEGLPMHHRFTMANMAVEAGAKNGIFHADAVARDYVREHASRSGELFKSDDEARYLRVEHFDVSDMEPQVALPNSPDNVAPISAVDPVRLDQVFIGSCTNGRLGDLREAFEVLKDRKVARGTRLIMIPGSPRVYLEAVREGMVEGFLKAGAVLGPPCCGPCLGGHMGVLGRGETALSTTNRNFVGRMGHTESRVYLANPAVAAASAVLGRIGSPAEL